VVKLKVVSAHSRRFVSSVNEANCGQILKEISMGLYCRTLQTFKRDDCCRLEIWLLIVWYKFTAFQRNMQTPLQGVPKRHKMSS